MSENIQELNLSEKDLEYIEERDARIAQQYCQQHQWMFLRQEPLTRIKYDDKGVPLPHSYQPGPVDIFYCQKCLAKQEIPA